MRTGHEAVDLIPPHTYGRLAAGEQSRPEGYAHAMEQCESELVTVIDHTEQEFLL